MASPSSQASAASISECTELESTSSPSVSRTPIDGKSSPDTGPESRASRTWQLFEPARTLKPDGTVEESFAARDRANALHKAIGNKEPLLVASTSSSEASHAKTSPSPGNAEGSPASGPPSSSSSPGSPMNLFGPEDGFWSRTSRDSSPAAPVSDATTAGDFYDSIAEDGLRWAAAPDEMLAVACLLTVRPTALMEPVVLGAVRVAAALRPDAFSMSTTAPSSRWSALSSAKSGFTTSPGEYWTAVTSECPSEGAVSSSLPDVLEDDVPSRFYLSPTAAAGILRRADKRGRELPPALARALRDLASQHPDDDRRTT